MLSTYRVCFGCGLPSALCDWTRLSNPFGPKCATKRPAKLCLSSRSCRHECFLAGHSPAARS